MQLTAEERDALERWRTRKGTLDSITRDAYSLAIALTRLFPVRTYGTETIRWDDPVTPERLVACGFSPHGPDLRAPCPSRLTYCYHIGPPTWFCEYRLNEQVAPRNMLEVWQLMERCGIDDKESFQ